MKEAIKILEHKRNEWRERGEFYRRASMKAHVNDDYEARDEARKQAQEAVDNINALNYAIEVLENSDAI
jgi:hypothetical protein